jgi:hypothetical protein
MERVLLAVVLVAAAVAVAALIQRRRPVASSAPSFQVPEQLDRSLFDRPDAAWLVAVFTSSTCDTCAAVVEKARALDSPSVVVQELEVKIRADLHQRYDIDAVPLVVVADGSGKVRRHFFGPVPTSELWAAVAEARDEHGEGGDAPGDGQPGC